MVPKSGSYRNSKLIGSRREIAKSCGRWLILVVVLALFYVIFNKKKNIFRARDFLKKWYQNQGSIATFRDLISITD